MGSPNLKHLLGMIYWNKEPFIKYVRVPREGGVGKITTYSYFGEGGSNPFLCNIFQVNILY